MTGFISITIPDIIDILLVATLLFLLYQLLKGTAAINIFFGIVAFYLLWKLVTALEMRLLSEIFGAFISVGFIALIVVFQPEIRKFLLMLGSPVTLQRYRHKSFFWKWFPHEEIRLDIDPILLSCRRLAEKKTGALIIIARQGDLESYIRTGVELNAKISSELIENIFALSTPLHDGAVIISNNLIRAAKCILPISENPEIPADLGLRHRAALGITENSDALAIVVSEETGEISFCVDSKLYRDLQPNEVKEKVLAELG
ncbi:MAG: diadenylate cyclase CdaA [Bacteroidales bacterium]